MSAGAPCADRLRAVCIKLSRIPMGRFVQPEEVASAIAYLLSDEAAMVNGIDLPVDGGFLIN